jgi:CHASE3 domain sensor protein
MAQPAKETTRRTSPDRARKTAVLIFIMVSVLFSLSLFICNYVVSRHYRSLESASRSFASAQKAAADLQTGSDYLTEKVRSFVVTGDLGYLEQFYEEVNVTRRRENAVEALDALLPDRESPAYLALEEALNLSNALIAYENHAMCLILDIGDYDRSAVPEALQELELPQKERSMTKAEKKTAAEDLVFGEIYSDYKTRIREQADRCTDSLMAEAEDTMAAVSAMLDTLLRVQDILLTAQLVTVLALGLFLSRSRGRAKEQGGEF